MPSGKDDAVEKDNILKSLERAKYKLDKQETVGLIGISCTMAILEALAYIIKRLDGEPAIEEPVAAEEKPEESEKSMEFKKEPEKKKKDVDYGKIVALSNAGWSQKKIGEEMGVSATAISVALRRYKDKMENGYIWDAEGKKFIKN